MRLSSTISGQLVIGLGIPRISLGIRVCSRVCLPRLVCIRRGRMRDESFSVFPAFIPSRVWISVRQARFPLCNSGNVTRQNAVDRVDTVLPCEYDNDSRLGRRNCIAIHWIQTWRDCKLETIFVLTSLCVEAVECKFPSDISKIGIRTACLWNIELEI